MPQIVHTPPVDGPAATPSTRTLGTGAQQACAGNDGRLSDTRSPGGTASGDLSGTYPAPTVAKSSSSTFAVYGATPVARPTAYTQTYATASRAHANPTAASVATTAATNVAPFGYATAAQADAIVTAINAVIVDLANAKQVLNQVIDDLQAVGLLQ
jgi:hypothetical protein